MEQRPRVVIVGAGFGGLWAARTLAQEDIDVYLIDRNNYHTFLPLLYQVAAAELDAEEIAYPIRSILRKQRHSQYLMAAVQHIDLGKRLVFTNTQQITYDYLVLALGSSTAFFGVPGAAPHSFELKTLEQSITLRNHLLTCFEQAAQESNSDYRRQLLTFTIIGGGATGVELAGALAELSHGSLKKDYPELDFAEVRIALVEAGAHLLGAFPKRHQNYTLIRLQRIGVQVYLEAKVNRITEQATYLHNGIVIPTATVVWTAGVQGSPLAQSWGLPVTRQGRINVLPTLQLPDYHEVYIAGDLAYLEANGRPLPMVAPVAVQQGIAAARNIKHQLNGQQPQPFRYRDRGTMVTIGRNAAVALIGRRSFTGLIAWVMWLGIHLYHLIGFHNRLLVLIHWAWDYLFYERAARLILTPQSNAKQQSPKSPE